MELGITFSVLICIILNKIEKLHRAKLLDLKGSIGSVAQFFNVIRRCIGTLLLC
jgi:hypothetical protein